MTRLAWALAALLFSAPAARCADAVQVADVGVKGYYRAQWPTSIRVLIVHADPQKENVRLRVRIRALLPGTQFETIDTFSQPLTLEPNEHRSVNIPVLLRHDFQQELEVQEIDDHGRLLGEDRRRLGPPSAENLIALLCSAAEICQQAQSQISFSGSPAQQTEKGKNIKFVTVAEPPEQWWAYSPVKTVVLARRVSEMTIGQREALEGFVREGGALLVVEDHSRPSNFLEPYHNSTVGMPVVVGRGRVFWVPTLAGRALGDLYAGVDFLYAIQAWRPVGADDLNWVRHRLTTHFGFPTLGWLLLWLAAYILVAGVVNFTLLRKLDRREWGWVTLPAISILCACAMYLSSASNRPHDLRAEDISVRWMDDNSPVAFVEHGERISSDRRGMMHFSMRGDAIFEGDRNGTGDALSLNLFGGPHEDNPLNHWNVERGTSTDIELRMLQWSFRDLEFAAIVKQPGTVRRIGGTHLRNETDRSFRQAMYVDKENVYLWNAVPSGSDIDLGAATKTPLNKVARAGIYAAFGYPTEIEEPNTGQLSRDLVITPSDANKPGSVLAQLEKPFDLVELIRAWPSNGGHAFDARSGLFFGLTDEPQPPISVSATPFTARGYSITIVSFALQPKTTSGRRP